MSGSFGGTTGWWYVDSVSVDHTISADEVPVGAGLKTSGGEIVWNPGPNSGLAINSDGTAYIPYGSLTNPMFFTPTGAQSAGSMIVYAGKPSLTPPNPQYPIGTVLFDITNGWIWRNQGNVWVKSVHPGDLVAGTFGAGVIYAGSIAAHQITAGNLQAGVIYSGSINTNQINTGDITTCNLVINDAGAQITTSVKHQNIANGHPRE
jgi:hypothetical protein